MTLRLTAHRWARRRAGVAHADRRAGAISTYYDRTGRVSGRSITGTNGATTYYDARARDWSRVNQQQHHDDL